MRALARHILSLAGDEGINNIKLQRIMYFVLGHYTAQYGVTTFIESVYDHPFKCTVYGPFNEDLHYDYAKYGRFNINTRDKGEYRETLSVFDPFIARYVLWPVTDLMDESMKRPTRRMRQELILQGGGGIYQLTDIERDFREWKVIH